MRLATARQSNSKFGSGYFYSVIKTKSAIGAAVLASSLLFGLTAAPAIAAGTASPSPSPSPTESPAAPGSCSAKAAISNPALGRFYGYVIDASSGNTLLDVRGSEQTPSASVLKVLTAATALTKLPVATYRAKTAVLTIPGEPSTIVLRGGGDFSLSQLTKDSRSTYTAAPRLETLAQNVLNNWSSDAEITKIILDSSLFSGPSYNPFWKASDRTNGYISNITALQLDSDRRNGDITSLAYDGFRSTDPIGKTGQLFKAALKSLAPNAKLVIGKTPKTAVELTSVSSQPMDFWLHHAMMASDNTETEFIARHVAIASGLPASFDSIEPMTKQILAGYAIDSTGLVMKDASGLAQADRVTPRIIAHLMELAAKPNTVLAPLESYLPVAGESGTLAGRFNGVNAVARNYVKGKSGFIPGLYSLAGIIDAKDGTRLAYAMFARSADGKQVGWATRGALDSVATRFYVCGAKLTK